MSYTYKILGIGFSFVCLSLSCSSNNQPGTSGGAVFYLQSTGGTSSCPDPGQVTIATREIDALGETKSLKGTFDGENGAVVRCAYNASRFLISLSQNSSTLIAEGDISGKSSTNVKVTVVLPNTSTYKTAALASDPLTFCSAEILRNADKEFQAILTCPKIENQNLNGKACSIGNSSFFQFFNCSTL